MITQFLLNWLCIVGSCAVIVMLGLAVKTNQRDDTRNAARPEEPRAAQTEEPEENEATGSESLAA